MRYQLRQFTNIKPVIRRYGILLALGTVAAILVLHRFNPADFAFYPRCPLFLLTGLKCAGCGTLRALHSALHGDFAQAIAFNPLLIFAIPTLILLTLKPRWAYNHFVGWTAVIIIAIYSIWRNL